MAQTPQTSADEERLAGIIATAVAQAIKSTQPSVDTTKAEVVVIGERGADPAIVAAQFCQRCIDGNPPAQNEEAVEEHERLVAEGRDIEAAAIVQPKAGVRRRISFDQNHAREQLAKGVKYDQCRS